VADAPTAADGTDAPDAARDTPGRDDTGARDTRARVVAVQEGLVTLEQPAETADALPLCKNEVIYVLPRRDRYGDRQAAALKGEVLRVSGRRADAQIYEDTRGVSVGDPVTQTGELLSAALGPGLLGQVFDGLQRPLETLARDHGTFLPRGIDVPALDPEASWRFTPAVEEGQTVRAGDTLGTVPEGRFDHRIRAPDDLDGAATVQAIQPGSFTVQDTLARLETADGSAREVKLARSWPVRTPLPQPLLARGRAERRYPQAPLTTTIRLIDTFFPVAKGGTACIPGPFGAGKTVLQNLIARYADVDVVVIVACGERAGEVVENLKELPELTDPRTGGTLMDRTVIVCNTSSMPVAARETSVYTGLTIGEYYRGMGLDVLVLADSTSRWAQAMRETSGRLEEIPGEEAFPAYLDSTIKALYERAGLLRLPDGGEGSLTLIGTVSPAGGNFEEPVTQSTLATVKSFLGLSSDRAYKRFYPAIDPLISWTRYRDQLRDWFDRNLSAGWTERVQRMAELLRQGDEIQQMMQVTGEEGVTLEDFVTFQKARLLDRAYLQQDAFDPVDVSAPLDRQRELFDLLVRLLTRRYGFQGKDDARAFFDALLKAFANLNTTEQGSDAYDRLFQEIESKSKDQTTAAAPD